MNVSHGKREREGEREGERGARVGRVGVGVGAGEGVVMEPASGLRTPSLSAEACLCFTVRLL